MGKSLKISTLIPVNLLNNPLASCSLINFDFLQSRTAHFNKCIVLPVLVLTTFGFSLFLFFLHFKQ